MGKVDLGTLADALIRAEVAESSIHALRRKLAECRLELRSIQRENDALRQDLLMEKTAREPDPYGGFPFLG